MKKLLSLILALVLMMALAACNKENTNDTPDTSAPETTEAEASTEKPEETTAENHSTEESKPEETTIPEETTAEDTTSSETTAEDTTAAETTDLDTTAAETEPEETTEAATAAPECAHSQTTTVNAKNATCADEGYTGDQICALCGKTISEGAIIPKASTHGETYLKDAKEATTEAEGYTGDTVCKLCEAVVTKGEIIPKKAEEIQYVICQDPYGNEITVPQGTDILDYTLANASLPAVSSKYAQLEAEILRLTNVERQKAGVPALENEPKAYYFASVRAEEVSVLWDHVRPNGQMFYHIYAENGIFYMNCGENLYACTGYSSEQLQSDAEYISTYAKEAVDGWMNSPAHKENLLNPDFTSIVIGIYVDEANNEAYAVQLFLD